MSANSRRTTRRLYRRMKIKDEKAVSPVVATLILILIAVAAAAALYLFITQFQTSTQNSIGSPSAQATITIGGSTSVYPFDQYAVSEFEANNSGITISNNEGGTGAGMLSVCHGAVDIGTASSLQTPSGLETNDGCPTTVDVTVFAYDAVDVITQQADTHGLVSIGADTLLAVYASDTPGGAAATTIASSYHYSVDGVPFATLFGVSNGPTGPLSWGQLPACVAATSGCGGSQMTETHNIGVSVNTTWGTGATCASNTTSVDICATVTHGTGGALSGAASPCGFTVCALGTSASGASTIVTVHRADTSGTEQTFTAKLLGIGSGNTPASSYSSVQSSFTGCGSDGQLASCDIVANSSQTGNPNVISYVSGHSNAIGFASDGLTRLTSSGVSCQGVSTSACGIGFEAWGQSSAVQPSLGSTGTIATAINNGGSAPATGAGQYAGWRPFSYVTTNTPTGEVAEFINWVLDPNNNQAVALDAAEISIYSI